MCDIRKRFENRIIHDVTLLLRDFKQTAILILNIRILVMRGEKLIIDSWAVVENK